MAGLAAAATAHATASFSTDWKTLAELKGTTGRFVEQDSFGKPTDEAWFGTSTALWHDEAAGTDWLVTGAPAENVFSGAAYVYSASPEDSTWKFEAKLLPDDPSSGSQFGSSVTISGNTIVVAAPAHIDDFLTGAAYVFVRDASSGTWSQQGEELSKTGLGEFAYALSLEGNTLAISDPANNKVFIYTRSDEIWTLGDTLDAPAEISVGNFGASVAIRGTQLLVGAPTDNAIALNQGSVELYNYSGGHWNPQQLLRPETDRSSSQLFGETLAMNANAIAIGAPWQNSGRGCTNIFVQQSGSWHESSTLVASEIPSTLQYMSVAMSDTVLAVSMPQRDVVEIYTFGGGTWTLDSTISSVAGSQFGYSVSTVSNKVVVGASIEGDEAQGKVYVLLDDRIFADGFGY